MRMGIFSTRWTRLALLALMLAAAMPARVGLAQQSGSAAPRLMLDTGGHMAIIASVLFTPDGKQIVSAGEDKVIRVWDWRNNTTVRTIRGEVGPGDEGKIRSMALSPDGRWLAVGGFLGTYTGKKLRPDEEAHKIRLYDFASGRLVALLSGHENIIEGLAFTPDGKWLVSGAKDFLVLVWDVENRRLVHRLTGHTDRIFAVAITPDGERAVTGGDDSILKLWSIRDGRLIATLSGHKDRVFRAAVSPTDGTIASGSIDGDIRLWDGRTGRYLRTLANQGTVVGALAFSPDGKWLVSTTSKMRSDEKPYGAATWEVATGKKIVTYSKHDNVAIAATVSPDGRYAATAGGSNQEIHVWDLRTGETKHTLRGTGAPVWVARFSADGQRIGWGSKVKSGWVINDRADPAFEVRLATTASGLGRPEPMDPSHANDFVHGVTALGAYSLAHRAGGPYGLDAILDIVKDKRAQASIERNLTNGYDHRAYAFTPDGQTVISGGSLGFLSAYNLQGQRVGDFIGHDSDVWTLTPSPDGRLLVSGSADQTARLWNVATRELIATLYYGADAEWVVWTPQGYYASSPNGDRIVGWQINKGVDQAAEYVTASQLRHQFYRPDIVERAIVLASAIAAIDETPRTRAVNFQLSDLAKRLPPKLKVLLPADGNETMRGRASITLALAESRDDPVKGFEVFVNDAKVTTAASRQGSDVSFDVPLGQGQNRVRVVARSTSDLLGEANLEIKQNGEGALDKRDNLFIIAIGVDKYPNMPKACGATKDATCDLAFSGADAKAFAETIESQMGRQHLQIVRRVLFNGAGGNLEPTRDNIENAFDILLEAKENDTIAVFVAGHGYNDPRSGYQFLPTNVRAGDSGNWASSSIVKWTVLETAIQAAKGRRLLFVDTCRSGSAYNARLIKDASDGGIVAFSATNMQQDAVELPSLGHGVFTSVLVKGLKGAADLAKEKEVRIFDLGAFVEREVRKLTNGRQTPDFYKKPGAENFVLVRM